MAVPVKLRGTTIVAVVALLVVAALAVVLTATTAAAGSFHRYTDSQKDYRITMRASKNRVLRAVLIPLRVDSMTCNNDTELSAGGFFIENAKIKNGRFQVVREFSPVDFNQEIVTFRGTLKDGTIRGVASARSFYIGPMEGGVKCWSGKSFNDPFVHFEATR